jgi:DNA polymerase-4
VHLPDQVAGGPPAIAYVDANTFFLTCEAIERGEDLVGSATPIVVGWDPRLPGRARSIVTTSNRAARALGITSGLSSAVALKRAREQGLTVTFYPPRHDLYSRYSQRLMDALRGETRLLEPRSVDEAALWWDGGYAVEPAMRLRERVRAATGGLTIAVGIAVNPLTAKIASEAAKGAGVHVVPPGGEAAFLAPLPCRALVGIGPKTEQRLRELGLQHIGDIAAQSLPRLVDLFGRSYGRYLHEASRGIDHSTLNSSPESRSQSAEHTWPADTDDRAAIWGMLRAQATEVAQRLRQDSLVAGEVAIKLRYADWVTVTRQQQLVVPTDEAEVLAAGAAALMRRHWDRRPIRLIGLRASRLSPRTEHVQLPLSHISAPR